MVNLSWDFNSLFGTVRGLEPPKTLSGTDFSRVFGRSLGGSEQARALVLYDDTNDIYSYNLKSITAIFTQNNCGIRTRLLGAREQWEGGQNSYVKLLTIPFIKANVKN